MKRHSFPTLALVFALVLSCAFANGAPVAGGIVPPPAEEMDRVLSDVFHADAPGAAVLVMQKGQVLLRKGYGLADLELQTPMNPAGVFRICSITKQFTAVAILQLVEAGKMQLDDQIGKYIPDYPDGLNKVTLAQLMNNTSGIPSITELSEWMKISRQDMTLAELLAITRNRPLDFAPGTEWKYSNTGFVLLGAAIEKVTGQSYADYIQTHIFEPAGMSSSYYDTQKRIILHRVPGYAREGKQWINAPFFSMTQPYASGALMSTVDDLWKWEVALDSGKLVGSALLSKAYTQVVLPDGRATNYGFGWEIGKLAAHPTLAHAGGMPGASAYAMRVVDADLFVAILCNTNETAIPLKPLAERLARLALGEPEQALAPADAPNQSLQQYAGTYRVDPNTMLTIWVENGKLVGRLGRGKRPLTAKGPDTFAPQDNSMQMTFMRDSTNRIDRVVVRPDAPGPSLTWPRVQ